MSQDGRILVLGIGNPLVGDEGVGVRVAEALISDWEFPERVTVMDAGTMGMGMLGPLGENEHVVVVDAVDGTDEAPGTVVRMSPEDVAPSQVLHSLHDVRLADVLEAAAFAGVAPHVQFVGVQVGSMDVMVTELTPLVDEAVSVAVAEVVDILERLGARPDPRDEPGDGARVIRALRTREPMRPPDGA